LLQGTLACGVNQAGAIRVIKPKLPEGVQIDVLVPSDENLYAPREPGSQWLHLRIERPGWNRFKTL
jgi:hypothetical protein